MSWIERQARQSVAKRLRITRRRARLRAPKTAFTLDGVRYRILRIDRARMVVWGYRWNDVIAREFTYEHIRRFQ